MNLRSVVVAYAGWLVPLIVVVVAVTAIVVNRIEDANRSRSVVVRVTNGPTVISTQVVRLP